MNRPQSSYPQSFRVLSLSAAILLALAACQTKQNPVAVDNKPTEATKTESASAPVVLQEPAQAEASQAPMEERARTDTDGLGQLVAAPPAPATTAPSSQPLVDRRQSVARTVESKRDEYFLAGAAAPPSVDNSVSADDAQVSALPDVNNEKYAPSQTTPFRTVASEPVSTFSIDVDTGSYTNIRRMLNDGMLPPADAVRQEEFINYFDYHLPVPSSRSTPFSVTLEGMAAPWNNKRELVMIGLKGYEVPKSEIPPANLVFLLDVSGSMDEPNKLPLLKNAFRLLVNQLSARDRVSIVVYAGAAGAVLPPTAGDQKAKILAALDQLQAGGSTNGGEGIELAYHFAREAKIVGRVNRIILATDGDFNVGNFDPNALKDYVAKQRDTGISLSTLGFGGGNYNDEMTEQLADVGNGQHAYIDSLSEAQKVLVKQISSTLFTIASDVKVQVEFNPAVVAEYRLIGYENRRLANEDFNNDQIDAGEIGAGHSVTAIYEIARVGSGGETVDAKRYTDPNKVNGAPIANTNSKEIAFLKLRYKVPGASQSTLVSTPIGTTLTSSERLRFAASVAGFAELLRGGKYLNGASYDQVAQMARANKGDDRSGDKAELVKLIELAAALDGGTATQTSQISE